MKKTIFAALAIALSALTNVNAQAPQGNAAADMAPFMYGGIGPVIAGSTDYSSLPEKARNVIGKFFASYGSPVKCEHEYDEDTYDVEFADGTEIEFDGRGEWLEVDAPGNGVLPRKIVESLMPRHAVKELSRRGHINDVETIKHSRKGYKVELREVQYDDVRFNSDGRVI